MCGFGVLTLIVAIVLALLWIGGMFRVQFKFSLLFWPEELATIERDHLRIQLERAERQLNRFRHEQVGLSLDAKRAWVMGAAMGRIKSVIAEADQKMEKEKAAQN